MNDLSMFSFQNAAELPDHDYATPHDFPFYYGSDKCGTINGPGEPMTKDTLNEVMCLNFGFSQGRASGDALAEALMGAIKNLEYLGPPPPGHSCGPEMNCDSGCQAFAQFSELLSGYRAALAAYRKAVEETK